MTEPKLYDLTLVNQVAKGNQPFIRRLCIAFITGSYEAIEEMNQARAENNWPEVSRVAHKVKSTIDTMNVSSARLLIREIESLTAQQKDLDQVPELIRKLSVVIEAASTQINNDFQLEDKRIPRS
jgi:HPt (histidine-containing phosphotransfer) domain-containing protein